MEDLSAELHTPPMNKIGLPPGMVEYSLRAAIRDVIAIYGRQSAMEIARGILEEETERRND